MDFKINTKKRIQIYSDVLLKIKNQLNDDSIWFSLFIKRFAKEWGLELTSKRNANRYSKSMLDKKIYYFKIIDKERYMLCKIKYGI